MQNFQKYLPSKKFSTIILSIIVIIIVFFAAKNLISFFKNKENGGEGLVQVTVGQIIQKDSNNNGIADWEEYLWGLNPYKDGETNKEYILSKKASLEKNGVISTDDTKSISQNELLSRQFFATLISLQQTGEVNKETLDAVSEAVGQNIEILTFDNSYGLGMLTIINDSTLAKDEYKNNLTKLIKKYENVQLGSELLLISQGLAGQDQQALFAANSIVDAYKSFGAELIKIPAPKSLAQTHLALANNYQKTGVAIEGMIGMLEDPIMGMRSILTYKKYSDDLVSNLQEIYNILQ